MGKTHRNNFEEYDLEDYTEIHPSTFQTPAKYIKQKLKILRRDFRIEPTPRELTYLHSLKTEIAIDKAIKKIISDHWGVE